MANEPDSLEADTGSLLESYMDMDRSNCGPHSSWGSKTDLRLEENKWEHTDKLIESTEETFDKMVVCGVAIISRKYAR